MTGCGLLNLEKLPLDSAHSGHQPVKLTQKTCLILLGLFNQFHGGTVANSVESISQSPIQEPHALLQIQELLM
jgi:hypothetical protein